MKEKSLRRMPCETQAVRVQDWFCKDRADLLCWNKARARNEEFFNKYKCDPIKAPKVPVQITHLPHQNPAFVKRKKEAKPRHITQGNPSTPLPITLHKTHQNSLNCIELENTLPSCRVAYCTFKEHFLVSKRLKYLAKQPHTHTDTKKYQAVSITSDTCQQDDLLSLQQEWNKSRQQRHFQIDRIIKYLAE